MFEIFAHGLGRVNNHLAAKMYFIDQQITSQLEQMSVKTLGATVVVKSNKNTYLSDTAILSILIFNCHVNSSEYIFLSCCCLAPFVCM